MITEEKDRLARRNDWYLRGWEQIRTTSPTGKKRVNWVYTGEYYDFAPDAPKLKIRVTLGVCLAVLTAVYFLMALSPARGNRTAYVSYPCFLGMIPLLYTGIGIFWILVTPGHMTYRRFHVSARQLEWSCLLGAVVMGFTAAAELFCIFFSFSEIDQFWDFFLLIGGIICAEQYLIAFRTMKKYPFSICGQEKQKLDNGVTI